MRKQLFFTDAMWPPTLDQVKAYFGAKGINDREAQDFFDFYQLRQWRNKKGGLLRSWKNAAGGWICFANQPFPRNA